MNQDDQATAYEELDRDLCLKRRKPELERTGKCYWCEEATAGIHCSYECRDDHLKYMRFNIDCRSKFL